MTDSALKRTLKNICCGNGWSYGVFWRFDFRNSVLLTLEEAYYEEHMCSVIETMLPKIHILGEGLIGQTAFSGRHRWIYSDAYGYPEIFCSSNTYIHEIGTDFHIQFSLGVKTVVVLCVEGCGVLQFGSTKKIPESSNFLEETKRLFFRMECNSSQVSSQNRPSMNSEICNPPQFSASSTSCSSTNQKYEYCRNVKEPAADACPSMDFSDYVYSSLSSGSIIDSSTCRILPLGERVQNICCSPDFSSSAFSSMQSIDITDPLMRHLLLGENFPLLPEEEVFKTTSLSSGFGTMKYNQYISDSSLTSSDELAFQPDQTDGAFSVFGRTNCVVPCRSKQVINQFITPTRETPDSACQMPDNLAMLHDPSKPIDFDRNDKTFDFPSGNNGLSDICRMQYPLKMACRSKEVNIPETSGHYTGNGVSSNFGRVSEGDAGEKVGQRKGLFSELGLDRILHAAAGSVCPISTMVSQSHEYSCRTRKRTSTSLQAINEVDSCSTTAQTQSTVIPRWVAPTKNVKKRERSGECARPRPKDRQMIQDRIKELRGLIPNGGKLSIDALLHRTVEHMIFLQEVGKHAEKVKESDEASVSTGDSGCSTGGATWGLEVSNQTLLCPILVQDLESSGQMHIEILCEEGVCFFEIADLIRCSGLIISKGMMEIREGNLWARFRVESLGHVTRMDVFMLLLDFLQKTASRATDLMNSRDSVLGMESSLTSNCRQRVAPLPINPCR